MKWTPLHVVGLFLLCVPVLAVFSNFACDSLFSSWQASDGFCLLSFAFLLHFTNFSQVNFWLRSLFATVAGFALVILIGELSRFPKIFLAKHVIVCFICSSAFFVYVSFSVTGEYNPLFELKRKSIRVRVTADPNLSNTIFHHLLR